MGQRVVAVVPARMASSRFPGKPLAPILGVPLVEHVRRRAEMADGVDAVVVATCDRAIFDTVQAAGGRAVMTADTHERCTDRVEEAMRGLEGDLVVIVQGDEPLLVPEVLATVAAPLQNRQDCGCVNLLSPLGGDEDTRSPDVVKAACGLDGRILFLSRAPIPFLRQPVACPVYRQTGIMAFTVPVLRRFARLPATPLERAEAVDLLRLLEHGELIMGVSVNYTTVGVDRPEDVAIVEQRFRTDPVQQALCRRYL